MNNFFESLINDINLLDFFVFVIFIYCILQCFIKGFSLSLISFMKWVLSLIITIILVPKLQPIVSDYIESDFVNNVGLGILIFVFSLYITIIIYNLIHFIFYSFFYLKIVFILNLYI